MKIDKKMKIIIFTAIFCTNFFDYIVLPRISNHVDDTQTYTYQTGQMEMERLEGLISTGEASPDEYVSAGIRYINMEEYDQASTALSSALEIDNNNYMALNAMALSKFYRSDYEGALEWYRKSFENSNSNEAKCTRLISMADCYIILDLDKAIDYSYKALEFSDSSKFYNEYPVLLSNIKNSTDSDSLVDAIEEFVSSDYCFADSFAVSIIETYQEKYKDNQEIVSRLEVIKKKRITQDSNSI